MTKTILRANAAIFLQICANLQKYWNNAMSIDGLIIEYGSVSYSFRCTYKPNLYGKTEQFLSFKIK